MKTITTFPNPSNEKRETSPNINQVLKIKYTPNVSTALNPNKGIINNTNKQVRKKIRGKDVPVRKIKKTNRSHPMQNLCTIVTTKQIKQSNITHMKYRYIRPSDKKPIRSSSKICYLPRTQSRNERNQFTDDNLENNSQYIPGK